MNVNSEYKSITEITAEIEALLSDCDGSREQWVGMSRQDRMEWIIDVGRGEATAEDVANMLATWGEV